MHVPFIDLQSPTQRIKERYLQALDGFLDRANFILTEEVALFEKQWAAYVGTKFCVGVSSGADALYIALVAAGVKAGDEVITQGNAYNASVTAILRAGAIPRFADIDAETLSLDVRLIEPLITSRTKALMPVHLFGQPCDMTALRQIADAHSLVVIEDAAQAHGARWSDRMVGSLGTAGAFSFYPTKNLGAFGDAGAITTDDEGMYELAKAVRNLGQVKKNDHAYFGANMRLDPMQAIALSLKLPDLDADLGKRIAAADYYRDCIQPLKLSLTLPRVFDSARHTYHLFVVQTAAMARETLCQELAKRGVDTAVHYPVPVYRQPFYSMAMSAAGSAYADACPVTDRVADSIMSLPFFPTITREQQDYVIASLKDILS